MRKGKDMQEFFYPQSASVRSARILYTPSSFARSTLLHLQEAGSLTAIRPHTSSREKLSSYLCFLVTDGEGRLKYEEKEYPLVAGDVVFIDCRKPYSHSTGKCGEAEKNRNAKTDGGLWSLKWCHFSGPSMAEIYGKYRERGGRPVFRPEDSSAFWKAFDDLYALAASSDYIRDMRINEKLNGLLTLLMEHSWHPENSLPSKKRMELSKVKSFLDEHFTEKISLEDLAGRFFINKCYLTRIFKETYGSTINHYILSKRITMAKQLLRFSEMTMNEIAAAVGLEDANYFSRVFHKVEGIRPTEYRKQW